MAGKPTEAVEHYLSILNSKDACQRGAKWLIASLENSINSKGTPNALESYYKSPLALAKVGNIADGRMLIEWIAQKYIRPDGHFQEIPLASPQRYCDLYQDFWLIWGAYYLDHLDIVQRCTDFVLQFYTESIGGFQSSIRLDNQNKMYELRSTALGGLVNLCIKNVEIAKNAGNFVIDILRLQPDLANGFYLLRDEGGDLVTQFHQEQERYFMVTKSQAQPLYYALGLATALLANLFLETRDLRYLQAAEKYVEVCKTYGKSIFQHHYSGKLGWGLIMLYRATHNQEYLYLAAKIANYLSELQLPTGEWHLRTLFPDFEKQPITLTLDRTAEYVIWLSSFSYEVEKLRQ